MTPSSRKNLIGYLFLTPYLSSFSSSFSSPSAVSAVLSVLQYDLTSTAHPKFVGLRNFSEALSDPYFWKAVRATALLRRPHGPLHGRRRPAARRRPQRDDARAQRRPRSPVPPRHAQRRGGRHRLAVVLQPGLRLFNHLLSYFGIGPVSFISSKFLAMPAIVLMSLWWTVGGTAVIFLTGCNRSRLPSSSAQPSTARRLAALLARHAPPSPACALLRHHRQHHRRLPGLRPALHPHPRRAGLFTRGIVQYIYETAFNQYRMGYGPHSPGFSSRWSADSLAPTCHHPKLAP